VIIHITGSGWCVHFVVTATQIPIGPWLLFDSSEEIVAKVFAWGHVSAGERARYENDLRRWGLGAVHMELTDNQLRTPRRPQAGLAMERLRPGNRLQPAGRQRQEQRPRPAQPALQ
jgi:hypothetical protein